MELSKKDLNKVFLNRHGNLMRLRDIKNQKNGFVWEYVEKNGAYKTNKNGEYVSRISSESRFDIIAKM